MHKYKVITFLCWLVIVLCSIAGCNFVTTAIEQGNGANQQLTISAATSLQDALNEIAPLYSKSQINLGNSIIRHNFGGSGSLQQQIINGAPVDIFISAASSQMDELQAKNLLMNDTRRNLLSNRLVLITRSDELAIKDLQDLTKPEISRVAIGDPRSVPVGQYAAEVLQKLGIWQSLQSKFVLGSNVRQVLQFVESGNAQAGIVYATDAKTARKVKVVQLIDPQLHSPLIYPIAILKRSPHQESAQSYVDFLGSEPAKMIFEKYGFSTF
ncbi:MAG: molybdate ABC transporter substrate-binding protein [Pseudanabaenaceae cyanobacterium bins.39]|nr:molybdate ABC transporter substrate-binding protein [Pseudanabaenaceae cyanobacterium bins.39]